VWFITGASRGFGVEIARVALARGDSVVATARQPETVGEALGQHPNLLAVRLDVTNEADAAKAVEAALARFGRIDVLVNNAGYGLLGAVEESSASEVRALFDTNVFGLLNVTRAVLPSMRARRRGHIVNLSSVGGIASFAGWGAYCSTKFAVEALTESLAAELAPAGIFATTVEPGFFRTDFLNPSSLATTQARIQDYASTVGAMRQLMAGMDHKQPGDPQKLAAAILRLVDSERPPVHLPLGSDTVAKLEEKQQAVQNELAEWRAVAVSTDHDDAVPAQGH
jgi:NAD(P)-dependent dehydrogenase (short-subunit alcohol dehydrogenase family)